MDEAPRPAALVALCGVVALCAGGLAGLVGGALAVGIRDLGSPSEHTADDPDVPRLRGTFGSEVLVPLDEEGHEKHVVFDVPRDAVAVRVRAESSRGPVALCARFSRDGADPWDADTAWEGTDAESAEVVTLDLADPATASFAPGAFEVCVRTDGGIDEEDAVRVTVHAEVVRATLDATVAPGTEWRGETTPGSGFRRTFEIPVPAGTEALRIDVADAAADLDLHGSAKARVVRAADAEEAADGLGAAEWIVFGDDDGPALPPAGGTVHVTVTDPSTLPYPVPFRLVVTAGEDPPPDLAATPRLPDPTDPRERALLSVVEILTDDGGGSGTLVTPDGRILTAYHVVEGAARAAAGDEREEAPRIVVAVTLDPREVARDLFVAEVVASDEALDLAMLRITGNVRGAPLPAGSSFPFVRPSRRTPRFLGETLFTVGYPDAGGVGTRVTQTLSRGVVAGYGRGTKAREIKTDAFVSPGSSGGAAFDDRWELVGVPVATTDDDEVGTVLGHVVPVEAVPAEWWR